MCNMLTKQCANIHSDKKKKERKKNVCNILRSVISFLLVFMKPPTSEISVLTVEWTYIQILDPSKYLYLLSTALSVIGWLLDLMSSNWRPNMFSKTFLCFHVQETVVWAATTASTALTSWATCVVVSSSSWIWRAWTACGTRLTHPRNWAGLASSSCRT